jgi:hypothetical protein
VGRGLVRGRPERPCGALSDPSKAPPRVARSPVHRSTDRRGTPAAKGLRRPPDRPIQGAIPAIDVRKAGPERERCRWSAESGIRCARTCPRGCGRVRVSAGWRGRRPAVTRNASDRRTCRPGRRVEAHDRGRRAPDGRGPRRRDLLVRRAPAARPERIGHDLEHRLGRRVRGGPDPDRHPGSSTRRPDLACPLESDPDRDLGRIRARLRPRRGGRGDAARGRGHPSGRGVVRRSALDLRLDRRGPPRVPGTRRGHHHPPSSELPIQRVRRR